MRIIHTSCFGILLLCSAPPSRAATPQAGGADIRVGPPQAHHNLRDHGSATVSWLERSVNFPGAAGFHSCSRLSGGKIQCWGGLA
jgi:hypothetical protein